MRQEYSFLLLIANILMAILGSKARLESENHPVCKGRNKTIFIFEVVMILLVEKSQRM